jgi:hypothetical protein
MDGAQAAKTVPLRVCCSIKKKNGVGDLKQTLREYGVHSITSWRPKNTSVNGLQWWQALFCSNFHHWLPSRVPGLSLQGQKPARKFPEKNAIGKRTVFTCGCLWAVGGLLRE